jgi:hypothetical protein
MKQTAVEQFLDAIKDQIPLSNEHLEMIESYASQAKEMEKNNIDNKVIHFAEWLTKKHTSTLITLYEHFEEEYYKETFKSEKQSYQDKMRDKINKAKSRIE